MPGADLDDLLSRPLIQVGCGRSGSTLFSRVLDAHPDVQFLAETDFVVARVWREVWDNRFWFNFEHHMKRDPASVRAAPVAIPSADLAAAKARAARAVRALFAELMQIDPSHATWGYKEIWNGNPAVATVPWSVYQTVFPQARWVHLVRDPFTFVKSSVRWNQMPLTVNLLKEELRHWREVVAWSRKLAGSPTFFEIRFEDLKTVPEATLSPILASVGLAWHPDCDAALGRRVMASPSSSPHKVEREMQRKEIATLVEDIEGLAPLIDDLGFAIPDTIEIQERNLEVEVSLPGPVDLRSMQRIDSAFGPSNLSKNPTLRRVLRDAVKRTLDRVTRSGVRNKSR